MKREDEEIESVDGLRKSRLAFRSFATFASGRRSLVLDECLLRLKTGDRVVELISNYRDEGVHRVADLS